MIFTIYIRVNWFSSLDFRPKKGLLFFIWLYHMMGNACVQFMWRNREFRLRWIRLLVAHVKNSRKTLRHLLILHFPVYFTRIVRVHEQKIQFFFFKSAIFFKMLTNSTTITSWQYQTGINYLQLLKSSHYLDAGVPIIRQRQPILFLRGVKRKFFLEEEVELDGRFSFSSTSIE